MKENFKPNEFLTELRTKESYDKFIRAIKDEIRRIKYDRNAALDVLIGTGMYDKNGRLKDEFR